MTINQTTDGVSGEAVAALEKARDVLRAIIIDKAAGVHYAAAQSACHQISHALELRALLDEPECKTCNGTRLVGDGALHCSSGGLLFENGPIDCVKDCPDCKPAAQPQGEPVAWQVTGSKVWADKIFEVEQQADAAIAKRQDGSRKVALYAEQPVPVAVQFTQPFVGGLDATGSFTIQDFARELCEADGAVGKIDPQFYIAPCEKLIAMGYRKIAPVAVVMPERLDLLHRDEFESDDQYAAALGEAKKWNACLDEVKRLNP